MAKQERELMTLADVAKDQIDRIFSGEYGAPEKQSLTLLHWMRLDRDFANGTYWQKTICVDGYTPNILCDYFKSDKGVERYVYRDTRGEMALDHINKANETEGADKKRGYGTKSW